MSSVTLAYGVVWRMLHQATYFMTCTGMRNLIGNRTHLERPRKIDLLYKGNGERFYLNLEAKKTNSLGYFVYYPVRIQRRGLLGILMKVEIEYRYYLRSKSRLHFYLMFSWIAIELKEYRKVYNLVPTFSIC